MASRPRYVWLGVVLAVSIAAACTIAAFSGSSGTKRSMSPIFNTAATATSGASAAQPPGMPIGLDFGDTLLDANAATLSAGLADATAIGASWIRIDLPWDGIQPSWSSTTYNWSKFDRLVAAAKARGLKLLITVVDPPVWARATACRSQEACEPADPEAYAAFAARAAARYAPDGVHDWEIWNEENLEGFASSKNPEAAYTTMLADTYTAVHSADPKALVMIGGLAMVQDDAAEHWIGAYDFLAGVAAAGGLSFADAVGVHPYDWNDLPQNGAPFTLIDSGKGSLESILQSNDHASTPFWITETGVPTSGTGPAADGPSQDDTHVTPQWQATLAQDIVATETKDPRIAGLFWYTDTDLPASKLYFGLRTASGVKKPVFAALAEAIAAYRRSLR
jgi:polysaccharide biosynthesis protein PslG